jgi:hypothetical protein
MCKDRTTKWDFGKSIKKREYETIIEEQSKYDDHHHHHQQQRPICIIRGREVKQRDLNRYLKRRKLDANPARPQSDTGSDRCGRESCRDGSVPASTVDDSPRQSLELDSSSVRKLEREGV